LERGGSGEEVCDSRQYDDDDANNDDNDITQNVIYIAYMGKRKEK